MGDVVSLFGGKVDTAEMACGGDESIDGIRVMTKIVMSDNDEFTYSVLADTLADKLLLIGMLDTVKRLLQESMGDEL